MNLFTLVMPAGLRAKLVNRGGIYSLLILILYLLTFTPAFAMFCPRNFNQVELGDNMAEIIQACGAPDTQVVSKQTPPVPQEWTYYPAIGNNATGTAKVTMAFDANNKLVNITANGIGVPSTGLCGSMVQVGDTSQQVQSACGTSSFIVNSQSPGVQAAAVEVTEMTYNTTPPVTFEFHNGKLVERRNQGY